MKEKILTLIIGMLIGAILATGGFLIYNNINKTSNENAPQMVNGGNMPQMPMQGGGKMFNGQMPNENNGQQSGETPQNGEAPQNGENIQGKKMKNKTQNSLENQPNTNNNGNT